MKYLKIAFDRKFDYKGRSSRKEFWWFFLCYFLFIFFINIFVVYADHMGYYLGDELIIVGMIAIFVIHILISFVWLACTVRRLHDSGKSGWWVLLFIIPLVGLYLLCLPSDVGVNKYGAPSPY